MKRTLLITISAIMVAMTANSQFKPGYEPERESSATSYPAMVSPYVPTKVTFAGETIDLDRNDLWERLDREMTSILYGHTNTLLTFKRSSTSSLTSSPYCRPVAASNCQKPAACAGE